MKKKLLKQILLGLSLLILAFNLNAQEQLASTSQAILKNKTQFQKQRIGADYILQLKFRELPTQKIKAKLDAAGIQLLSYHANNTFIARLPVDFDANQLVASGVSQLDVIEANSKISTKLLNLNLATAKNSKQDVAVIFHESISSKSIHQLFQKLDAKILTNNWNTDKVKLIEIDRNKILELSNSPAVAFIDVKQASVQKLNYENRTSQRLNILNAPIERGGKALNGSGVCVGVGDGGQLGEHIDFGTRVINKASGTYRAYGAHGDHVTGIIGGAGNLNPRHRGIASDAELITQKTTLITFKAEEYLKDFGMVLTNNSYGVNFDCETNGSYNYTSLNLDEQLRKNPELLHVFAAGNSGSQTCNEYPKGFKTVLRYYAAAKNVLTVGAVDEKRKIASLSSRGPVEDGRIKPEICGTGINVISTGREYDYFISGGTSMAAPSVTGTLALMYERYKQLNGVNPEAALMKAIICNTAEDLGNAGPDYTYGFGFTNGRRAIQSIDNNNYFSKEIAQQQNHLHPIEIPQGVRKVKVLLYWSDKEADITSPKALVNDLDLSIIDPSNNTVLPWVLNTDPTHVDDLATRGIDTLNNIEQITIDLPAAGTYQIKVNGTNVPFGPQGYHLSYELIESDLKITYPLMEEILSSGKKEIIQWDVDETNTASFKIEYLENEASTWKIIAKGIDAKTRFFEWSVPAIFSEQVKLRISKENDSQTIIDEVQFFIMQKPSQATAKLVCEGYTQLNWDKLDFAESYDVFLFENGKMNVIANTKKTNFLIEKALEKGTSYWFAISARTASGKHSERSKAIKFIPEGEEICPWESDVKILNGSLEIIGRERTKTTLSNDHPIIIQLKNIGNNVVEDVSAFYTVNQSLSIEELLPKGLGSGDSIHYRFNEGVDFSLPGTYHIDTWLQIPVDSFNSNDTIWSIITARQIEHPKTKFPFEINFENVAPSIYFDNQMGLAQMENWDFETYDGELEILSNQDNHYLHLQSFDEKEAKTDLILNLNLEEEKLVDQLLLSFDYYTKSLSDNNKVWIRGADDLEWLPLFTFDQKNAWTKKRDLDLMEILQAGEQELSSSFQIRFSQNGADTDLYLDNVKLDLVELEEEEIEIAQSILETKAYPNPFTNHISIDLLSKTNSQVKIRFFDLTGRLMMKIEKDILIGKNTIELDLVNNIPLGQYICQLKMEGIVKNIKLVKFSNQ